MIMIKLEEETSTASNSIFSKQHKRLSQKYSSRSQKRKIYQEELKLAYGSPTSKCVSCQKVANLCIIFSKQFCCYSWEFVNLECSIFLFCDLF